MSAVDSRFRRNFVVASVLHVALIGGVVFWESFFSESSRNAEAVQLVTPADILGELPKGEGRGRGAYKAPPPGADAIAGPNEAMSPSDENVAPQPKPVPNEIGIPKKAAAKKPVKETKAVATKKPVTANNTKPKPATDATKGPSADEFRRRFASALKSAEEGTVTGDNKPAGGGTGKSGRIGSPTGSPDGIPGGMGPGSPFWDYYQHVHDQMYEAWEQPGDAVSRKLMATVMLRVARDGTITDVELKRSSGNKLMDDSAVAAARSVQRLEPPPDALVKDATANITVDFQVEG